MILQGMVLATTEQMLRIGLSSVLAEHPLRGDVPLHPGGKHVLTALVVLDHRGGEPCDPFIRCRVILVGWDGEPIEQSHLDVDVHLYAELEPAPGVEEMQAGSTTFHLTLREEES